MVQAGLRAPGPRVQGDAVGTGREMDPNQETFHNFLSHFQLPCSPFIIKVPAVVLPGAPHQNKSMTYPKMLAEIGHPSGLPGDPSPLLWSLAEGRGEREPRGPGQRGNSSYGGGRGRRN